MPFSPLRFVNSYLQCMLHWSFTYRGQIYDGILRGRLTLGQSHELGMNCGSYVSPVGLVVVESSTDVLQLLRRIISSLATASLYSSPSRQLYNARYSASVGVHWPLPSASPPQVLAGYSRSPSSSYAWPDEYMRSTVLSNHQNMPFVREEDRSRASGRSHMGNLTV